MRKKRDTTRINKKFFQINQDKIMYLIIVLVSFFYIIGILSKGVINVDYYVEWTRAIVHGNLFEIYNIENGKSISAENKTLIVPYPPLSLYLLWLFAKLVLFFVPETDTSLLIACNTLAVFANFATVFLIKFMSPQLYSKRYRFYLFSPTVLLMSPILGYQDSVMIFLIVSALFLIQSEKIFLGGIFFGAAIMTKQLAFMPAFAIFIFFIFMGHWQKLLKWVSGIICISTIVLSPFIVSGNLFAYIESQVLASVHTMLAPQTANIPWLITLIYNVITNGLLGGFAIGGNGLRIGDDALRQIAYLSFGVICILIFLLWLIMSIRKYGRESMNIWSASAFMILSYYLFAVGVHENHIFMAFAIILCIPQQIEAVKAYILLSVGLFLHLYTSWGLGRSFQEFSDATHLSLTSYSMVTLIVLAIYIYSFSIIGKLPKLKSLRV